MVVVHGRRLRYDDELCLDVPEKRINHRPQEIICWVVCIWGSVGWVEVWCGELTNLAYFDRRIPSSIRFNDPCENSF
jgi:hypothetical protein